jgi:hypothetical protein
MTTGRINQIAIPSEGTTLGESDSPRGRDRCRDEASLKGVSEDALSKGTLRFCVTWKSKAASRPLFYEVARGQAETAERGSPRGCPQKNQPHRPPLISEIINSPHFRTVTLQSYSSIGRAGAGLRTR